LLLQPDFGSTAVIFLMTFIMLYIAKAKVIHLASMLFYGLLGATILILISSERLSRLNFLEPCKDYDNAYQLCWSLMAIGSGGIFGKGLGQVQQSYHFYQSTHRLYICNTS
jgi:cell division protein FtsW